MLAKVLVGVEAVLVLFVAVVATRPSAYHVERKLEVRLEFVEPMESTAIYALTLATTPSGSFVTWSMDGNHNFVGKAFGIFMDMDNMLGTDIEKGLAQLKTVAEGKQVARAAEGEKK